MVAEAWIMQIQKLFLVKEFTEEQKVSLATSMPSGEAENQWCLKKDTLPMPTTWDQFLDAFLKKVFPVYIHDEEELQDLC